MTHWWFKEVLTVDIVQLFILYSYDIYSLLISSCYKKVYKLKFFYQVVLNSFIYFKNSSSSNIQNINRLWAKAFGRTIFFLQIFKYIY